MDSIWLDLRSGFGQLRRAPLVAAAAVLTLAVGIGVTTAVFSFVAAVMDASTPVDDMNRRVALWSRNFGEAESKRATSPETSWTGALARPRSIPWLPSAAARSV